MFARHRVLFIAFIALAVVGAAIVIIRSNNAVSNVGPSAPNEAVETKSEPENEIAKTRHDFSLLDDTYRFSGELPQGWVTRYVEPSDAIAVFHSEAAAADLNNASIFIRNFTASSFLTLGTVNILSREDAIYNSHTGVRYEIEKKPEVANFADQPLWRSSKHKVVDIRLAPEGETAFFVFAYKPDLREKIYSDLLNSLIFYNDANSVVAPLDRVNERVTKKSFGTKVSPDSSPVSPERFSGYHTGWDFETFVDELSADVPVKAICGGALRVKTTASGYGGYAVQECQLAGQVMTVLYGHLRLSSVGGAIGSYYSPGEQIGLLGNHESSETDGERKHLHLSIHPGSSINIRGYVSSQSELVGWIDPDTYL